MQPPPTGLARYRSAPATWLEALLESEEEDSIINPPKPTTHVGPGPGGFVDLGSFGSGEFLRQNSVPADFLSSGSDGYFGNFGGEGGYEYLGQTGSGSGSGKRAREVDSGDHQLKFSSKLKGEQSEQLHEADMDKLLEDSVACRIRAKRGCATHPRSIAERVRRTRISDRIRKLQDLLPNTDKQTNTADMLEEAVEYVKFLQKQIQDLTENQKKCKCSIKD